jgi:anti-sigma factor RsiW
MNCGEIRPLLEAHCDGELDLVRQLEVEAHLRGCAECAALAGAMAARRQALGSLVPRFTAPSALRARVRAAVGVAESPRRRPASSYLLNLGGLAAALALAAIGGYSLGEGRARGGAFLREAVSDHVRSLQAGHLMDVVSTDQHTVRPWFVGKLDFSPPVFDLVDAGFPLAGGRLDQVGGRAAAALVYRRRQHTLNLFVWAAAGGDAPARQSSAMGYNAEGWSEGGLSFLAVSEIPAADLSRFVDAYRARASPSPQ